jgi:hypothetical protein
LEWQLSCVQHHLPTILKVYVVHVALPLCKCCIHKHFFVTNYTSIRAFQKNKQTISMAVSVTLRNGNYMPIVGCKFFSLLRLFLYKTIKIVFVTFFIFCK